METIPLQNLTDIKVGTEFRFVHLNEKTNLYTVGKGVFKKLTMLANKPPEGYCIVLEVDYNRTRFEPEDSLVIQICPT